MKKYIKEPLVFQIFCLWVLALPFFRVSIVSSLSVDNLMVPIIFFAWLFSVAVGKATLGLDKRLSYFLIMGALFLFSILGDIVSGTIGLKDEVFRLIKVFSYILLPVLCIQNIRQFELTSRVIVVSTVMVCVSAVLDSVGLLSLDFLDVADRSGDVRLEVLEGGSGINAIKRSAGLVGEFGSMALLAAFVLATLLSTRQEKLEQLGMSAANWWRWLVILVLTLGAVAAQSRNVLMASIVVISVSLGLGYVLGKKGAMQIISIIGFAFFGLIATTFIAYYAVEIYSAVLGEGTMKASGDARVSQYIWALDLVKGHTLFGVDPIVMVQNNEAISLIHNLWLYQLVSYGFFGLVPLLMLFIKVSLDSFRLAKKSGAVTQRAKNMFGLSLAIPLAGSFYAAQAALIFWFLLGVTIAFNVTARTRVSSPPKYTERVR